MTAPRTNAATARDARPTLREWVSTTSFQIVAVPAALSMVGLLFSDWLGRPGLASIVTLLIACLAGTFFWAQRGVLAARTRASPVRLARGEPFGMAERFDALVLFVSASAKNDPGDVSGTIGDRRANPKWRDSLAGTLENLVQPRRVALLQSEASAAVAVNVEAWLRGFGLTVRRFAIQPGEDTDVSGVREIASEAIVWGADAGETVVDVTGGTSVFSIALYQAAVDLGCCVTYLVHLTEPPVLRLIFDPTPEHAARAVAPTGDP
jgi:hypothetical protein